MTILNAATTALVTRARRIAGDSAKGKALFSSATGPYATREYDTSPTDVWNQRFSRGCDIFTLAGHIHTHFAHAICQNISIPSTFLEYPTEADFIAEIRRGYDWVGLSGFQHHVPALIHMGKLVRKHSPRSKIVFGGWAAMGIEAAYTPEERSEWVDHICVGEGISFMRKLIGDDPNAPISITHLPKGAYSYRWIDKHMSGNVGAIVASMGCTHGCDFCGPTSLFDRRRIQLLEPAQVVSELDRMWKEQSDLLTAAVYEEDSFLDKDYMMEVGRGIREDTESGLSRINMMILGGVRSLDQWEFDEVAECGISMVFIGVESKFAPTSGYNKSTGRPTEVVFRELHRRGISTIGGWVGGFDFQNRDNVEEDLQHFIALQPTMQQLTRLCPFPGTPLWTRLREEGALPAGLPDWDKVTFYGGGGFKPKGFEGHEIDAIIDRGYRQLYEAWGSCFARQFEVNLNGYEYCREHSSPWLNRDRARLHKRQAGQAYPFMKAMEVFSPNGAVRRKMQLLQSRYERLVGPPTTVQKVLAKAFVTLVAHHKRKAMLRPDSTYNKVEPYKRYIYDHQIHAGGAPYRTAHPNFDVDFEFHRRARGVLTRLALAGQRGMNELEDALWREVSPELRECLPAWGM